MKTKNEKVVYAVEGWLLEEELPTRSGLKVLKSNHPDHGLTEDEVEARNEFIAWHLSQETALLNLIPASEGDNGFFLADLEVTDTEYSAFNTHDFQRFRCPVNGKAYAQKKLAQKVKDLAILHSCLSTAEGRVSTQARFKGLLEAEFQDRLENLAQKLHQARDGVDQAEVRLKIGRIQRQVWELSSTWAKHAQAP